MAYLLRLKSYRGLPWGLYWVPRTREPYPFSGSVPVHFFGSALTLHATNTWQLSLTEWSPICVAVFDKVCQLNLWLNLTWNSCLIYRAPHSANVQIKAEMSHSCSGGGALTRPCQAWRKHSWRGTAVNMLRSLVTRPVFAAKSSEKSFQRTCSWNLCGRPNTCDTLPLANEKAKQRLKSCFKKFC